MNHAPLRPSSTQRWACCPGTPHFIDETHMPVGLIPQNLPKLKVVGFAETPVRITTPDQPS